jgi:Ca2+-binding RTX toxin-like protein
LRHRAGEAPYLVALEAAMPEPFLWGSLINLPAGLQNPHVTALSNGTFLVLSRTGTLWEDSGFKAWIYNADGTLREEKALEVPSVYTTAANATHFDRYVLNPVAAELPDGRIAVTWSMRHSNSGNYGVAWLSLYGDDLQPLGSAQPIAGLRLTQPYADGLYASDDLVSLSDGNVAIAYRSYDGQAFVRILGKDGVLSNPISLGPTLEVNQSNVANAGSVIDLTALPNGKAVVVVRGSTTANHFYILDTSDAGHPTLSDRFTIPVNTPSGLNSIEVTALEGGVFVVTWVEMGKSTPPSEPLITVKFQIYDAEGGKITEPLAFYASDEEAGSVGTPDILSLPGGGFALAAQVVPNNFPMNTEVRLAIFNAEGERVSEKLLVSKPAAEGVFSLKGLSRLADGRIAVHLSDGIQIVDPRDKAVSLKGTAQNDHYIGTAFNDTFESSAGADRLEGAGGNDTYQVDNAGDRVIEKANEGIDTVEASVSYVLSAHVEHLIATGSASIALTGNALANTITGNAGANRIDGGAGADTMQGGLGNDTLDGGAGADILNGGDGFDFVSFASSDMGVSASLAGASGDGAGDTWISIEGIVGSDYADILTGNGATHLHGGAGHDTYRVRSGDVVAESGNGGRDTVLASSSYTLLASAEVEVLKLSGVSSKRSSNLTGSNTANEIIGHGGKNTLRGLDGDDVLKASSGNDTLKGDAGSDTLNGGTGNDKLYGGTGTGKDVFVFDTKPNKTSNVDWIYDFNPKYDSIQLENKIFMKLGKGSTDGVKVKADMFVKGDAAKDKEDRIVYDNRTGALYYDQDGTGSKAQVKIATLSKNLKLTYHDFFVI